MKRLKFFLINIFTFFFMLLLLSGFSNAALFKIGNVSDSLESAYGYGENIRGVINLSLTNIPSNSLLTLGEYNTTIGSLILGAELSQGEDYTCFPSSCSNTYSNLDNASQTKTFSLNTNNNKLIGIKIVKSSGEVDNIRNFVLNITSEAPESCNNQISVDILDDGEIDWQNMDSAPSFCGNRIYGCNFSSGVVLGEDMQINDEYCEILSMPPANKFSVGAELQGSGEARFKLTFENEQYCEVSISSSGEASCSINRTIEEAGNYSLCISKISGAGSYKLYFKESSNSCGSLNGEGEDVDFSIFAKKNNYAMPGNISLKSQSLDDIINSYMETNYQNNCSLGCFIPIRITSNIPNQNIRVNNVALTYNNGLYSSNSSRDLFTLKDEAYKITMPFTFIDMSHSGLRVPSTAGKYNITIKLGGELLLRKYIEVLRLPIIEELYPLKVPAAAKIKFYSTVSGANISSYDWTFGDNDSLTTTLPMVEHKYSSIGNFVINLGVSNVYGRTNRSFNIEVVSPKDYLNSSFITYLSKIADLKKQLNNFSEVKSTFENKLNLTSSEIAITGLKTRFASAGGDPIEYINIMNDLSNINLPDGIIRVNKLNAGKLLPNPSLIKVGDITSLSSENINSSEETVREAVFDWIVNSIELSVSGASYSYVYTNSLVPAATYYKVVITPKKTLGSAYLIINAPTNNVEIISGGEKRSAGALTGVNVDLSSAKTVEFIIFEDKSLMDIPFYLSPSLADLKLVTDIGVCNNNGKCEDNENSENCINDCKPNGRMWMWIIIVLIVIFILYIICQEWYKRKYEGYLFKDRNDLYNLIYFITNAEEQAMDRNNIAYKLKDKGWDGEQITYAYNKFHGKRTGMWEIPIFKFLENKKVDREMQNRQKIGASKDINAPPRPMRPLMRPNQINHLVNRPQQLPNGAQPKQNVQQIKPSAPQFRPNSSPASNNTQNNVNNDQKNNNSNNQNINKPGQA